MLFCALPVAAAWACFAPTEVIAVVSTDVDCASVQRNGILIKTAPRSGELTETPVATESNACEARGAGNDLGTLVLVPSGDGDDLVIEVVLGVDRPTSECRPPAQIDGCIVARRRVGYLDHRSLRVPIALSRSCLGVPCGEDETCDRAVCVSARVESCPGGECVLETEKDAAPPESADGAILDATIVEADVSSPPIPDAGPDVTTSCPPRQPPLECASCGVGQECCIAESSAGGLQCVPVGTCPDKGQDSSMACSNPCQCPPGAESCGFGNCPVRVCGANCSARR